MNLWQFIKRRWMELRWGHSTYLVFLLSGVNFLLITYRFLIEYVPPLKAMFPQLWIFAVIFLVAYCPIAIVIGHWHREAQLSTEQILVTQQNPYLMDLIDRVRRIEAVVEQLEKTLKSGGSYG